MLYTFDQTTKLPPSIQDAPDEMLMLAVQKQCSDSLNELYRRHHSTIRAVIARVLHNEQSVEDLVQEVFLEVWKMAARYSAEKGKALGWMITLSRRRAIDRLRREQAYYRIEERFQKETEQQPGAWTQVKGDFDVENSDMRQILKSIIESLPEAQKTAIHLAFYQGLSQREIASQTNIPLGTIKTRLELGVRKIGNRLRELRGEAGGFSFAA